MRRGMVYLVGAGPGDPELMTIRASRLLREADVILFDRLSGPKVLEDVPADTELVDVGKVPGRHKLNQEEINSLLVEKAKEGKTVVRLKGGDPYLFGRGGEEGLALAEEGIPFDVVPGITSAISVPARMGIPITHRGVAAEVTIVTGHEEPGKIKTLDWSNLARLDGTLVVLMGVSRLEENVAALVKGGREPKTPAALIEKGWSPEERMVTGSLDDIVDRAKEAGMRPPAILVVGHVVDLAKDLRPPAIAILRPEDRSEESASLALAHGYRPLMAPVISFERLPLPEDLADRIGEADCVVFTSATGVEIALDDEAVADSLKRATLVTIGPRTKEAVEELGLTVSQVPESFSSKGLVDLLGDGFGKVLLLRSAKGSPELLVGLVERGVDVEEVQLYDVVPSKDSRLDWLITHGNADVFTFASGSTAGYLLDRAKELGREAELREKLACARVAAIGPPTAAELKRLGIRVDVMPEIYTFEAMLEALDG